MRREYSKPFMKREHFAANEFVAACVMTMVYDGSSSYVKPSGQTVQYYADFDKDDKYASSESISSNLGDASALPLSKFEIIDVNVYNWISQSTYKEEGSSYTSSSWQKIASQLLVNTYNSKAPKYYLIDNNNQFKEVKNMS